MLADKGANPSVLPLDLTRRPGIPRSPRRGKVELADGTRKERRLGTVVVRLLGRPAGDTVLIASPRVEPLLGVEALEALGLAVDPRRRRPRATRAHGALLVGVRTLQR